MKKCGFSILGILLLLLLASCNQDVSLLPEEIKSDYPDDYSSERLYSAGEIISLGEEMYQATTAVKGYSPSEYLVSVESPMNPWRLSSMEEFRLPEVARNSLLSGWGNNFATYAIATYAVDSDAIDSDAIDSDAIDSDAIDSDAIDSDAVAAYAWSSTATYTANTLAVRNGKYYKAKWWNQNNDPSTPYANAWDSPWAEITEAQFETLMATTPPVGGGDTGGGDTGGDVGGNDGETYPSYATIVQQGFIQEWDWDDPDFPAEIKAAFNAAAVVPGDIFAVQDGSAALALFSAQINAEKWEQLFPRRRGAAGWNAQNPGKIVDDYYSFANFSAAMLIIGEYAYLRDVALDSTTDPNGAETSFEKNYVLHKPTRKVRLISQSADYFAEDPSWLTARIHRKKVVDYAAFGREGSDNDKKRVVAGFLAHASHETSGSWATAPDYPFNKDLFVGATFPSYITNRLPGELAWSLYFNEEVAYAGATSSSYTDSSNKIFPPTAGQSYHGRGAFQLSWNYNYGLASAIFFGDSNVLLDNPNFILTGGVVPNTSGTGTWRAGTHIEGGTMAFLTSLMFWLTPQGAKPSQQDVMILNRPDGLYVEGVAKLVAVPGRGTPGYGWTINIMNGGYEAGKSWEVGTANYDSKVARRVKHYLFFTQALGGNNTGEVLDTVGYTSY